VRCITEDFGLKLDHDAMSGCLHIFLFCTTEIEEEGDEDAIWENKQMLRVLVKAMGGGIDQMDSANASTPLMVACEKLTDLEIIKILVQGGADVNAVNEDDQMPLTFVEGRLKEAPDNEKLLAIAQYLKSQGAVANWRELKKEE